MDQIPNSSREFKRNIYVDFHKISRIPSLKDDDTDTINMINNENDKTVTNFKYYDLINFSNMNESNMNDLKSFFDIEDEVHNSSKNISNNLNYSFMNSNEPINFMCKFCHTSIGNENSLNYESNFIELTKDHNIFNVKKDSCETDYCLQNCSICEGLVGFHLKVNLIDNKRENKYFLIPEYVKIKKEHEIRIGLFCMKDEYLKIFQNYLISLSEVYKQQTKNEIWCKLVFRTYKMTKESLNKNYKKIKNDEIDCAYIIHKNEGRLFLLGRNGYYNKLIEDIFPKLYGRVAFVLINNSNTNTEDIMDKLVFKGDQKSLQLFHNDHKFFFINDDNLKNIVLDEGISSLNLHFCFQQFSSFRKNFYLIERQEYIKKLQNVIDPIDTFLQKLEGPKMNTELENNLRSFVQNYENIKNGKSNKLCFML